MYKNIFFNLVATFEENNDIPRGGVTTIADIAFATLNSGKNISNNVFC